MGRRNKKKESPHPPGTTAIEGGSRHLCSLLLTLATTVASLEFSPRVHAAELGYGGRLAEASGAPAEGPVSMSVRFYTAPTGGDPVGPTLSFPDTPLVDGIFQLTLSLNDLQMNQVFGSGDHEVYVEVASQDKIYPRQKFLAVPYALRIPVDGDTLTYGTNGRLTVGSISQSQVSGLALALSAKADANTVAATLAGKADTASVTNQLAAKADATALATKAAVNATLSGDVSGALNGPITVDKIKNTALPTPNPSQDGGKYLQYNGAEYVLSTISGSSGGTVTSVTASLPLSVTNGSTTPALTLSVASGVSDGYLTSSDFTAFNNKQSAITTSSTVNAGTLTTEQQNGLQIKPYSSTAGATGEVRLTELAAGGTEYVGFKAPDSIAVSRIWTLPALDGSDGQVLKTNGAGILSWVSPGNSGTVTSVNLTAPTNGITVTGGPITSSGSISIALADDLAAVEALSTTGGVERTGASTWGTYTLTTAGKALIAGADAAAQRTTLGLGTLATASSVSGGTGGTIADDSITDADINASAAIAQSKISGLTTALSGKEPSIAGGTASQYYRGDKTWATLGSDVVTEGSTNLYFTNARARSALSVSGAPLSYNNTTGVLSLGQASSGSDGFLSSSDFTAFTNKQSAITTSSTVNSGTLTTAQQNGLQLKPYSSTAGATGEVRLTELAAGGTEYVGFKAPDSIAVSRIWTLPALDGSDGQVLKTNGAGILSWVSPGNSGTVTSVNLTAPTNGITVTGGPITSSGSIFLSLADDLAAVEALSTTGGVERTGANTWGTYTLTAAGKALLDDVDATAQRTTLGLGTLATASSVSGGTAGTIADDSITDADINASAGIAQSKILGLTTSLSGKEPTIAAGTTTQYYRGDKTWQTLGSDIVTEGTTNLYFTNTRARNALSVSGGLLSYNSSTGVISLTSTGSTSGTGGGAASNPSSGCPSGYILVPGDTDYGTTDFCVMKYEAKFGDKGAESRAAGLPARGTISQNTALAACRNLGPGYALINNAEWMTIAANVANVASNWSGNAVGSGALNRGHSDNDPAIALAASTDSSACSGTNQTCSDTSWNDQRRTHKLSNNNVIWDLAGNVWEWVDYNNYEDKPSAAAAWAEYTAVSSSTTMAKTSLVPTKAQKSWWTDTWNGATNGIGQYYAGTNGSGGALLRGGYWSSAAIAGVFTAILNNGPSLTFTDIGFRCVFRPASP